MTRRTKILKKPGWKQRKEAHEAWLKEMGVGKAAKPGKRALTASPLEATSYTRPSPKVPTQGSLVPGGVPARKEQNRYTGDFLIGIGTMHKSNPVPVSSKQQAEEIARMRHGG